MTKFIPLVIIFSFILSFSVCANTEHPRIYVSDKQKNDFSKKIMTCEWAKQSFDNLQKSVDTYVNKHQTDPEWMISRMQMYWDTHHERIYVKGNFFSHGTGKAPVSTVKFAGARDWETDYAMPSLEDTQPYMDEKGMYVQNMKKEGHPWEWVHPSKTGRMIGNMNDRILEMAANASFLYWFTGEKKYAVFANDIFITYVKGIHFRREPFALENYTNSHLMGLGNFEVILDHVIPHMAVCYDFLYDYLKNNNADINMIESVFKRFADQQIIYGVPDNNWNIFQARHVTYMALVLEDDSKYADGKGKQYYLNEIFNNTTIRQFALKETMDIFDQENGMWPESASYSMAVCNDMLDILCLVENAENNQILDTFPIIKKAVPATVQYVFPNGRVTAFGDARYTPLKPEPFEKLISLYRKNNEAEKEKELTCILQKMIDDNLYQRDKDKSLFSLFFYVDQLIKLDKKEIGYDKLITNSFYVPNVSLLMQRNGTDIQNGMALSLVGAFGNHAHANGISMEMYAKGLMIAPESSFGVSYGSKDNQEYYARFPAHNTVIVDGKSDYGMMRSNDPFELLACYPASEDKAELVGDIIFARTAFTEPRTNASQERITSVIRTGDDTGYFVDIFRSKRNDGKDLKHEYLLHTIAQDLVFSNEKKEELVLNSSNELSSEKGDQSGYNYFTNKHSINFDNNFTGEFKIDLTKQDDVYLGLYMKAYPGRTIFSVNAPKSRAFVEGSVPDELLDKPLKTMIIRQEGEAWSRPFIAVYEPFSTTKGNSISSVNYFSGADLQNGIEIISKSGRKDYIFNSSNEKQAFEYGNMKLEGNYGVISEINKNQLILFLGSGKTISKGLWKLVSPSQKEALFSLETALSGKIKSNGDFQISIPHKKNQKVIFENMDTKIKNEGVFSSETGVSVAKLPQGNYTFKIK